MRAVVLMPVIVLAVSAGHAEMGFAQGLPGQVNTVNTGASASSSMYNDKSGRLVVAYGAAYGAPGNQPNYAPNGGRPNVSMPGGSTDDTAGMTPEQRAAAALATIKIPGFSAAPANNRGTAPAYQPAMPTISSMSPTYAAPAPQPTSVPMPAAAGLTRVIPVAATQVVVPTRSPGRITGLPLGMSNAMGGAASAPLVNEINSPPSAQPAAETAPITVPQTQAYVPPTYVPAAVPTYRAPAPTYGAPTAQAVTYRTPAYLPPQPAYVAPKPAAMSYTAPTRAVDPASCGPTAATPAAYVPSQPAALPRPAEPERLPSVAGGPGFTLVAPPPGAPYPNAGYVEPGNTMVQPAMARVAAPAATQPAAFLPTTQPHDVGTVRGVHPVRAVNHRRVARPAGTDTDPWEAPQ